LVDALLAHGVEGSASNQGVESAQMPLANPGFKQTPVNQGGPGVPTQDLEITFLVGAPGVAGPSTRRSRAAVVHYGYALQPHLSTSTHQLQVQCRSQIRGIANSMPKAAAWGGSPRSRRLRCYQQSASAYHNFIATNTSLRMHFCMSSRSSLRRIACVSHGEP
jgi:hypothetical protein